MTRLRSAGPLPFILVAVAAISASRADPPAAPSGQEPQVIVLDPAKGSDAAAGSPADGEAAPEVVPFPGQGVNSREILGDLWFRHRALLRRGQTEEAARLINAAIAFMDREGLRAAPEIAGAFLAEAGRAVGDGDYRLAREDYQLALRFEPTLADGHFGLAAALVRGDRDLSGAAREWWAGVAALLRDPESLYYLAGNGFLVLYLGLCLGGGIALVLLALRAAPAYAHDLQERFSGRLTEGGAHLVAWTLLALPAIAFMPLPWMLAAWAALLFGYFRTAEKVVTIGTLLLLILAGAAGRAMVWHFQTASDPAARALLQSARAGPDLRHEEALKQIARERPNDSIYPFLLASAYRAGGHFDDAMAMYEKVLEIDPNHVRAMVNLGNLHALRQEFPQAQKLYHHAGEIDPKMALAHYNSHLAHLEVFSLEAADAELRQARQIDDAMIAGVLARAGEGQAKRMPQDAGYSRREIWDRAVALRMDGTLRRQVALALTAPTTLAAGAGLLAALLMPGLGIVPRPASAQRCRRCGRPFCRMCQVATKYPDSCAQCVHLFILRDGLAPSVKERKLAEIVRFKRAQFVGTRIVSLVLPGSGHVAGGRPMLGAALLSIWSAAWIGVAVRGRDLVFPGSIAASGGIAAYGSLIAIAMVAWLFANLSSREMSRE